MMKTTDVLVRYDVKIINTIRVGLRGLMVGCANERNYCKLKKTRKVVIPRWSAEIYPRKL